MNYPQLVSPPPPPSSPSSWSLIFFSMEALYLAKDLCSPVLIWMLSSVPVLGAGGELEAVHQGFGGGGRLQGLEVLESTSHEKHKSAFLSESNSQKPWCSFKTPPRC